MTLALSDEKPSTRRRKLARLNEVASPTAFGHGRFACGIFMPVINCSDPQLALNQRFLGCLEVSYYQIATIQIP